MNYEEMSYDELYDLLLIENEILHAQQEKVALISHHRKLKAQEIELLRKLGNLGDSERDILKSLLNQTTSPAPIESAEDIQL